MRLGLNNGWVRRGDELKKAGYDFDRVDVGVRMAVGYVYGCHVSRNRSAFAICGSDWNLPSTIYRLPVGEIKNGDEIDPKSIPPGTLVLFRK